MSFFQTLLNEINKDTTIEQSVKTHLLELDRALLHHLYQKTSLSTPLINNAMASLNKILAIPQSTIDSQLKLLLQKIKLLYQV